jgi:outer membrane protein assembly factor BamB
MRISVLFFLWIVICTIYPVWSHDSWERFRGPQGNGHVQGDLPLQWSEQDHVKWKVAVPGKGHSSPVVSDNVIWLTTALTQQLSASDKAERLNQLKDSSNLELAGKLSLRAASFDCDSGRMLHDVEVFQPESVEPIHATNTYASPTAVLHAGRLYVHFGTYGTACLDAHSGEIIWRFSDLKVNHQNGPGSSPIVWNDLLIVHFDGTDKQCIAALNLNDGSLAWQTERSGEMHPTPELQKAYSTPTVVQTKLGPELISPAANWVYAYDPRNGSELWKANYGTLGFSTVPCPVADEQLVFVCTSFMQSRLLAVKFGGRGDVTKSHVAWTAERNVSQKPSLALLGQRLYTMSDAGILTCINSQTGKEVWRQRVGGSYSASPLICQDRLYFFSMEGKTTVIRSADEYQELAINSLDSGMNASPAAVDGSLIIRTDTHLYRIQ